MICDFCRTLYEEIDYINEAKNAERFRRDFRNIKWVRVPVCGFLLNLVFFFHFFPNYDMIP